PPCSLIAPNLPDPHLPTGPPFDGNWPANYRPAALLFPQLLKPRPHVRIVRVLLEELAVQVDRTRNVAARGAGLCQQPLPPGRRLPLNQELDHRNRFLGAAPGEQQHQAETLQRLLAKQYVV